jgi:hypothetical protein
VEEYTKAVKKLVNQIAQIRVIIPEPLVIIRYLKGLGSAYSVFYTTLITNYQILPADDNNIINLDTGATSNTIGFDAVALKTKGHEKTLQQQDNTIANVVPTNTTLYKNIGDIYIYTDFDIHKVKVPIIFFGTTGFFATQGRTLVSLSPELLCKVVKELPIDNAHELLASCRHIYDNGKFAAFIPTRPREVRALRVQLLGRRLTSPGGSGIPVRAIIPAVST